MFKNNFINFKYLISLRYAGFDIWPHQIFGCCADIHLNTPSSLRIFASLVRGLVSTKIGGCVGRYYV